MGMLEDDLDVGYSAHLKKMGVALERATPSIVAPKVGVGDNAAKALTYDDGKAPLANVPWAAIDGMAMVQSYGNKKYGDFNNYRKGMEVTRNLSCALRHIKEYIEGVDLDPESGRNHLEHAMCRIAFTLQNIHDKTAIDDRFKKP